MSSSNTDLLELLRVLDHPKAVYLIQRRFSRDTRKRPQEKASTCALHVALYITISDECTCSE